MCLVSPCHKGAWNAQAMQKPHPGKPHSQSGDTYWLPVNLRVGLMHFQVLCSTKSKQAAGLSSPLIFRLSADQSCLELVWKTCFRYNWGTGFVAQVRLHLRYRLVIVYRYITDKPVAKVRSQKRLWERLHYAETMSFDRLSCKKTVLQL